MWNQPRKKRSKGSKTSLEGNKPVRFKWNISKFHIKFSYNLHMLCKMPISTATSSKWLIFTELPIDRIDIPLGVFPVFDASMSSINVKKVFEPTLTLQQKNPKKNGMETTNKKEPFLVAGKAHVSSPHRKQWYSLSINVRLKICHARFCERLIWVSKDPKLQRKWPNLYAGLFLFILSWLWNSVSSSVVCCCFAFEGLPSSSSLETSGAQVIDSRFWFQRWVPSFQKIHLTTLAFPLPAKKQQNEHPSKSTGFLLPINP